MLRANCRGLVISTAVLTCKPKKPAPTPVPAPVPECMKGRSTLVGTEASCWHPARPQTTEWQGRGKPRAAPAPTLLSRTPMSQSIPLCHVPVSLLVPKGNNRDRKGWYKSSCGDLESSRRALLCIIPAERSVCLSKKHMDSGERNGSSKRVSGGGWGGGFAHLFCFI